MGRLISSPSVGLDVVGKGVGIEVVVDTDGFSGGWGCCWLCSYPKCSCWLLSCILLVIELAMLWGSIWDLMLVMS